MMNDVTIMAMANDVVAGILRDMCGRSGLQNEWDMIDEEVQEEIKHTWTHIAFERMKEDLHAMTRRGG